MAYDEGVAQRVRESLRDVSGATEKRMFGGLAFLIGGNMACGVLGAELMVRVGPDAHEDALAQPGARVMDFTGKPSKGMVYVAEEALEADEDLSSWVNRGVAFAGSLPPK